MAESGREGEQEIHFLSSPLRLQPPKMTEDLSDYLLSMMRACYCCIFSPKKTQNNLKKEKETYFPFSFPLLVYLLFPSYLCKLLAAAEFLSECVEFCCDRLIGPSQFSGRQRSIFLGTSQDVDVTL